MKKSLTIFMVLLFVFFPIFPTVTSSALEKSSDKSVVSSVLSSAKEKIVLGAEKTKKVAVNAANSKAVQNALSASKKIGKNLMNPVFFALSLLISGLGWFTFNGVVNRADIKKAFSSTDLAWKNKVAHIIRLIVLGSSATDNTVS